MTIDDVTVTRGRLAARPPATFTVSLSQPSGQDVTVFVTLNSGTATFGSDFSAFADVFVVAIPAGTTSLSFDVDIIGDVLFEGDETFTVDLARDQRHDRRRPGPRHDRRRRRAAAGPVHRGQPGRRRGGRHADRHGATVGRLGPGRDRAVHRRRHRHRRASTTRSPPARSSSPPARPRRRSPSPSSTTRRTSPTRRSSSSSAAPTNAVLGARRSRTPPPSPTTTRR